MTTIRPNPFPQAPVQAPSQDAAKLAAQKAFFAMVSGQAPAQPATATSVAQPPTATPAPAAHSAPTAPDLTQKIPRPGSLFDIRV